MAFYLPKHDAIFIHIPKCAGHFVESVFDHYGIDREPAKLINNTCPRHGQLKDYEPAGFSFCTIRDVDSWMKSWWRFHFGKGDIYDLSTEYHHKEFGPPVGSWETWRGNHMASAKRYLQEMSGPCNNVINVGRLPESLAILLVSWGYNADADEIRNLPKQNRTELKIELGGGVGNIGGQSVNVDMCDTADLNHNLDSFPYPFKDCEVSDVYSSHCLEHLKDPIKCLLEIARICKVGAKVEIRVPHYASEMAMCGGHISTLSKQQIINMDVHFPKAFWHGDRRLKLVSHEHRASAGLAEAKNDLPFLSGVSDESIMKWIQGTCHEIAFHFEVIKNNFHNKK